MIDWKTRIVVDPDILVGKPTVDDADIALAVKSFEEGLLSIGEAARRAGMSVSEFIDLLGKLHIPVAHYEPGELEKEIDEFG